MRMITTDAATLPDPDFLQRLALCFEADGKPRANGVTVSEVDDRARDAIADRLRTLGDDLATDR